MKKFLSIALALCLAFGLSAVASAERKPRPTPTPTPTPVPAITINIPVTKTWDDESHDTERPEKITVSLMNGETVVASIDLTAAKGWAGTFENVPEYDASGAPIQYMVAETAVENYTPSYEQPEAASLTVGTLERTEANSITYFNVSTNLIFAKKGNAFYIWTETALNAPQKAILVDAIDKGEYAGLNNLDVDSIVFWNGFKTSLQGKTSALP